jgi:hexosaminidase
LFYGVQTTRQLLMQCGRNLPDVRCTDWPDFPNRGLMLDVSRNKAPTMPTLFALVEMLASWKINQLQLYFEHMYAYRQHPTVWQDASPFTAEEIVALDRFCRARFVELVPNQNSFGHLTTWLTRPEYNHLAEAPEGCDTIWGFRPAASLQPTEESLRFLRTLYDELLPNFSSRQFNVGCDETIDLGKVRSKAQAEEVGIGRLYVDFLKQIHREVRARGYTMQFWGDIITHYPELVRELPRDAVALEWGYEADHPFDEHGALFAASGIPFYVCPGTSTWNSIVGRTTNTIENMRNAARNGLKHGAVGFLNTDWGDNGHWQPLAVSYLGLAAGAAYGWALDANCPLPLPDALSRFAFRDATGIMGRLAYDLGDIYRLTGISVHNASVTLPRAAKPTLHPHRVAAQQRNFRPGAAAARRARRHRGSDGQSGARRHAASRCGVDQARVYVGRQHAAPCLLAGDLGAGSRTQRRQRPVASVAATRDRQVVAGVCCDLARPQPGRWLCKQHGAAGENARRLSGRGVSIGLATGAPSTLCKRKLRAHLL